MTRTVRRHAGRTTYALLLLVGLAVAALFLVPKALGYDVYVITTGSMKGTVDPGGLVIADRVPVGELAVGDVITYVPPAGSGVDHLVTHRIADIGQDEAGAVVYQTKGDANSSIDPWTFSLDAPVQARMQWTVPSVGWPVLWLTDRDTRMLAIGIPALAIALIALKDLVVGLLPQRPVPASATDPTGPAVIDLTTEPQVIDLTSAAPTPVAPAPRTLALG